MKRERQGQSQKKKEEGRGRKTDRDAETGRERVWEVSVKASRWTATRI